MPSSIWGLLLGKPPVTPRREGWHVGHRGRAVCELRLGLPPAPFHLPKPGLGLSHTRGCSVGTGRFCGFLGGFLILKAAICLGIPAPGQSQRVGRDSGGQQNIYWALTVCQTYLRQVQGLYQRTVQTQTLASRSLYSGNGLGNGDSKLRIIKNRLWSSLEGY